jgi:threonylcarbamoyladenosine tRNA methylthiotransferase MtaB
MQKTFNSFSFGCRVNQAEKEALDRQLLARGYTVDEQNPETFIINTCSITNKAEREARQMINQIRKKHAGTKIVVMGCAATNWIKTKATVENVDMMVENPSKEFIADLIEKKLTGKASSTPKMTRNAPLVQDKYIRSGRVIIKIQDGCQRFCTYCIVPYLRGLPKTYPIQSMLEELQALPPGLKEVIYTAINTEAYGYEDKKTDFIDLLQSTLEQTSFPRISFGSIHPWNINEKFFTLLKTHPEAGRIVKFFHIPLQSGNNKMLGLMKRGYTREEFLEKLDTLNKLQPFTFIGTDIIVGFLEESDADFQDTYDFLERTPISKIHIFRYSPRQHTAAFYLGRRLKEPSPQEKLKRAKALDELNKRKYKEFQEKHIGSQFEALFLEQQKNGFQQAVLDNQMPVLIKGTFDPGSLQKVEIKNLQKGSLIGVGR